MIDLVIQKYQICLFSLACLTSKVLNEKSNLSLTGTFLPETMLQVLHQSVWTTSEAMVCPMTLHKIHAREMQQLIFHPF